LITDIATLPPPLTLFVSVVVLAMADGEKSSL